MVFWLAKWWIAD